MTTKIRLTIAGAALVLGGVAAGCVPVTPPAPEPPAADCGTKDTPYGSPGCPSPPTTKPCVPGGGVAPCDCPTLPAGADCNGSGYYP